MSRGRPRGKAIEPMASEEARRRAAAILEVLGGLRSPAQAAEDLGCSLPRYFVFERRAMAGLVAALDRAGHKRLRSERRDLAERDRRIAELARENARLSALVRATQRSVGLNAPKAPARPTEPGKRMRKPRSRARTIARLLRKPPEATANEVVATNEEANHG